MSHTLARRARGRQHSTWTTGVVAIFFAAAWLCLVPFSRPAAGETAPVQADPARTDSGKEARTSASLPSPRRIMIIGDSFAVGLAMTMQHSLRHRGDVALTGRGKVSSGLNSPRFYDWEKALAELLAAEKPQALVVMLGGNDAKNGPGTPQWSRDYRDKAKRLLAIAASHGVVVYWVGLPPMRERSFSQRAWTANEATRAACAEAKGCRFIDSWDLFADAAGNFCAKKPVGGKAKALRGKDGVHFTPTGCKLLTDRIAPGLVQPAP
jgi:hypothetical protein